jgi:type I restriction enzyme R subunit
LDFRNATDLFADPQFDGEPIRIKPVTEDTDLGGIVDEEEENTEPIIDIESGEEIDITPPTPQPESPLTPEPPRPREKVYVNGVDVSVLISRELHFDQHGKPITTSLKDHTKEIIKEQFASLDDFLNKWKGSERKEAIIAELVEQGVMVEALYEAVDKQVDLFDLICHVAYDQPPMTRKERANNVKKRNYFTKYGDQARKVLEALLDKYADQGIENIENIQILTVPPINEFGSVTEIIKAFGSREEYEKAIKELENELYKVA